MIPKIIHFCWFGGNPLPKLALECIASWRRFLPEHEIWMWVEKNSSSNLLTNEIDVDNSEKAYWVGELKCADRVMEFDVDMIPYTKEAYAAKKYAFVSDYARFWVLYKYGGVYFDTDVEVIKPIDDILEKGAFMGFERDPDKWGDGFVAPGLGMAVNKDSKIIDNFMQKYDGLHFLKTDETLNIDKTIVHYTTEVLNELGMKQTKGIQELNGIILYPSEYFAPINFITRRLHITDNTRTIHRYMASWADQDNKGLSDYIKHYLPECFLLWANRIKNFKNWK